MATLDCLSEQEKNDWCNFLMKSKEKVEKTKKFSTKKIRKKRRNVCLYTSYDEMDDIYNGELYLSK